MLVILQTEDRRHPNPGDTRIPAQLLGQREARYVAYLTRPALSAQGHVVNVRETAYVKVDSLERKNPSSHLRENARSLTFVHLGLCQTVLHSSDWRR